MRIPFRATSAFVVLCTLQYSSSSLFSCSLRRTLKCTLLGFALFGRPVLGLIISPHFWEHIYYILCVLKSQPLIAYFLHKKFSLTFGGKYAIIYLLPKGGGIRHRVCWQAIGPLSYFLMALLTSSMPLLNESALLSPKKSEFSFNLWAISASRRNVTLSSFGLSILGRPVLGLILITSLSVCQYNTIWQTESQPLIAHFLHKKFSLTLRRKYAIIYLPPSGGGELPFTFPGRR